MFEDALNVVKPGVVVTKTTVTTKVEMRMNQQKIVLIVVSGVIFLSSDLLPALSSDLSAIAFLSGEMDKKQNKKTDVLN